MCTYVGTLCGDNAKRVDRVATQHEAQTADDAEGKDELAGDGKIAQPLHGDVPFQGDCSFYRRNRIELEP